MKILLLDNYDSFTYNLLHLLEQVDGVEVDVVRQDVIIPEKCSDYDGIIFSPGPGLPSKFDMMSSLLQLYSGKKKILGVCLGHQAVAMHFGAKLLNLSAVRHGVKIPTLICDPNDPIFKNIPSPFQCGRYHSWIVSQEGFPSSLKVTALDSESNIMAIRHLKFPIWGVQFHPESILTEHGKQLINNWLSC